MSATSVSKYRLYCNTESTWVYSYQPTGTQPSVCPNNNSHIINPDSISDIETVSSNTVQLTTDSTSDGSGNYRHEMKEMVCLPNSVTKQRSVFPYDVNVLSFQYNTATENLGDYFDLVAYPPMFLGVTDYIINVGTTTITCSRPFIENTYKGFYVIFVNPNTGFEEEVKEVISVDTLSNTIVLSSGLLNEFPSGTYYKPVIPRFTNTYLNVVSISTGVGNYLRASKLIQGFIGEVRYTNRSANTKKFVYGIDMTF